MAPSSVRTLLQAAGSEVQGSVFRVPSSECCPRHCLRYSLSRRRGMRGRRTDPLPYLAVNPKLETLRGEQRGHLSGSVYLGNRFVSWFSLPGSGFRIQGSGFRVPGSRFRMAGSGIRDPGCEFRVPSPGLQVAGCELWVADCGFRITGSEFRVLWRYNPV